MREENRVIQGTTCFKEHQDHDVECVKQECKYWIDSDSCLNCTMIMAAKGPSTLQEIGELFGVTRMRICQIEKSVIAKMRSKNKIDY